MHAPIKLLSMFLGSSLIGLLLSLLWKWKLQAVNMVQIHQSQVGGNQAHSIQKYHSGIHPDNNRQKIYNLTDFWHPSIYPVPMRSNHIHSVNLKNAKIGYSEFDNSQNSYFFLLQISKGANIVLKKLYKINFKWTMRKNKLMRLHCDSQITNIFAYKFNHKSVVLV